MIACGVDSNHFSLAAVGSPIHKVMKSCVIRSCRRLPGAQVLGRAPLFSTSNRSTSKGRVSGSAGGAMVVGSAKPLGVDAEKFVRSAAEYL